jgi:septal ring factor EnvC (AmiA/AmiB activator)
MGHEQTPAGESTSARLARVEAELSGLRHDLAAAQQALADADQDRAELRDAVAERAEALQLAEAENATLRARLVRAHAQCALPDPSSRGSSS